MGWLFWSGPGQPTKIIPHTRVLHDLIQQGGSISFNQYGMIVPRLDGKPASTKQYFPDRIWRSVRHPPLNNTESAAEPSQPLKMYMNSRLKLQAVMQFVSTHLCNRDSKHQHKIAVGIIQNWAICCDLMMCQKYIPGDFIIGVLKTFTNMPD